MRRIGPVRAAGGADRARLVDLVVRTGLFEVPGIVPVVVLVEVGPVAREVEGEISVVPRGLPRRSPLIRGGESCVLPSAI
jgi:hypothetical protein